MAFAAKKKKTDRKKQINGHVKSHKKVKASEQQIIH